MLRLTYWWIHSEPHSLSFTLRQAGTLVPTILSMRYIVAVAGIQGLLNNYQYLHKKTIQW